jgi:single-stranded-DNA-specific exonuclease
MKPSWEVPPADAAIIETFCRDLPIDAVTASVLASRGFHDSRQARAFLFPSLGDLRSPFALQDMAPAVERIARALARKERILVFGDYDVDGISATALLQEFLAATGAQVDAYIPHRLDEGYGLQADHVARVLRPRGVQLVITTDCGMSSHAAVQAATREAIDVIITDHHMVPPELPPALAVINPRRADCRAGLAHLSGAGTAFCLLVCLRTHLREIGFWPEASEPNLKTACDLVALGTIADMVPLVDDNRILTRAGLELIGRRQRPGINALMAVSRVEACHVDAEDIGFRLAPRLNAAGRIDHAHLAVRLLTATDPSKAQKLAQRLDRLNSRRREMERELVEDIESRLDADPRLSQAPGIVMAQEGWHEGILGIAASRIARRFGRPVVLLTRNGTLAKGSARSVPGVDLYRVLESCQGHLARFGGHPMAAGLALAVEHLEGFRRGFETALAALGPPQDIPDGRVDRLLRFDEVRPEVMSGLEKLQPFGQQNPEPLFLATDVHVESERRVGDRHRQLVLAQETPGGTQRLPAVQFAVDSLAPLPRRLERLAFHLRMNRWNGRCAPQLVVRAMEP